MAFNPAACVDGGARGCGFVLDRQEDKSSGHRRSECRPCRLHLGRNRTDGVDSVRGNTGAMDRSLLDRLRHRSRIRDATNSVQPLGLASQRTVGSSGCASVHVQLHASGKILGRILATLDHCLTRCSRYLFPLTESGCARRRICASDHLSAYVFRNRSIIAACLVRSAERLAGSRLGGLRFGSRRDRPAI